MAYKNKSGLPVSEGGTSDTSLIAYTPLCGGTTSTGAIQSVASIGTAGQVLTSNGAAALPTFQNAAVTGITTIDGDSGSVTGSTVSIKGNGLTGAGQSILFSGAGTAMSLNVTDASHNIYFGSNSGQASGLNNNAFGSGTLGTGSSSRECSAFGYLALHNCSGNYNCAFGNSSLSSVDTGVSNTCFGYANCPGTLGSYNTTIGYGAGSSYAFAESSNIVIGASVSGTSHESNVLRIGNATGSGAGNVNKCYIAGIDGINVGSTATIVTEASNQLGTAVITAGTGISVTPGANTITIANTIPISGVTWAVTTVDATAVVGNGYFSNKAGLLTMTLPATAAIGDVIEISNMSATAIGWRIAQNANQFIRLGASLTTTGVGGYLEATQIGDSVKLVCKIAGASTGWQVTSCIGNITVV